MALGQVKFSSGNTATANKHSAPLPASTVFLSLHPPTFARPVSCILNSMAPAKQFNRKDLEAALAQGIANAGNSNRAPKRVQVSSRQYWFLNKAGHGDDVVDSKVSAVWGQQ